MDSHRDSWQNRNYLGGHLLSPIQRSAGRSATEKGGPKKYQKWLQKKKMKQGKKNPKSFWVEVPRKNVTDSRPE